MLEEGVCEELVVTTVLEPVLDLEPVPIATYAPTAATATMMIITATITAAPIPGLDVSFKILQCKTVLYRQYIRFEALE